MMRPRFLVICCLALCVVLARGFQGCNPKVRLFAEIFVKTHCPILLKSRDVKKFVPCLTTAGYPLKPALKICGEIYDDPSLTDLAVIKASVCESPDIMSAIEFSCCVMSHQKIGSKRSPQQALKTSLMCIDFSNT